MSDRLTATAWRRATTRLLTVDDTVRRITLTAGRYALFGSATQVVRFGVRNATAADGTLASGEVAPTLALAVVGSPGAGVAWDAAAAVGEGEVPADVAAYRFIEVAPSQFLNLYVRAPAGVTAKLIGPIEWHTESNPVG